MKLIYKGLILALLHVGILCSLGAKLLYDRAHRPRMWIKTAPVDPNLPIRGRYLSLNIEIPAVGFTTRREFSPYRKDKDGKPLMDEFTVPNQCDIAIRNGQLTAIANQEGEFWGVRIRETNVGMMAVVPTHTAYFLPEHASDPSRLHPGEELWIEATIPRKGPPRPIRLGIKKDGILTPLSVD
jgi:uncharacterized membrane-anchored protein